MDFPWGSILYTFSQIDLIASTNRYVECFEVIHDIVWYLLIKVLNQRNLTFLHGLYFAQCLNLCTKGCAKNSMRKSKYTKGIYFDHMIIFVGLYQAHCGGSKLLNRPILICFFDNTTKLMLLHPPSLSLSLSLS